MRAHSRLYQKVTPPAKKLQAIAHPTRLAILAIIAKEPSTPADICRKLSLSGPLASHHLSILKNEGWLTKTVFGKLVTYYLVEKKTAIITSLLSL